MQKHYFLLWTKETTFFPLYSAELYDSTLKVNSALSGLRQVLTIESPLKMIKSAFYFISKALFGLKIFKFLSWLFGHVAKQLD